MMTEIPTVFLLFCFDREVFCRATSRHLIKNNVSRAFFTGSRHARNGS